ncbi:MAG TPA: hypothetical protein VE377_22405 [Candidatus Dormibacteraeota bacterium]|nr:hypothetical protein [Candidatus Dormibacteraeota bacterium]
MTELQNPVLKIWQEQPVEGIKMSVDEIHLRAGKFERRIMWRNIREYVASLIAVALFVYFFATTQGALSRITFALFIAGMLWIVIQLHLKGSAKSMPAGLDTLTSLRFYRAELERQREVVSKVWSWYLAPMVPGFVVYTVGYAVSVPRPLAWAGLALMDVLIAALFFWIWKMNMRAARCLQRMIDELNAATE